MKKFKFQISLVLSIFILIYACGKDDEPTPEPVLIPTITDFSPISGPIGAQVTITGTNFGATNVENIVKFGKVTAVLSSSSTTSLVTTVPEGAATSKISVTANKKTAISEIDFTVTQEEEEVSTIALDSTSLTLYPYSKYSATLSIIGNIGTDIITWTSSDDTIATVDANGLVTPLAIGNVIISANVADTTVECVVTIKDGPVTKLELDNSILEMYREDVAALNISILEAEVLETSPVVWNSDNTDIATVDDQGNVTAIGLGEVTITATVDNAIATCTIIVNPNVNVYVAGYEMNDENVFVATLWVNGISQALSNGDHNAEAKSVFVNDSGYVYVLGHENYDATLWTIDGDNIEATTLNISSYVNSIFVKGEEVYLVGNLIINNSFIPMLWDKDGNGTLLESDESVDSYTSSVYVTDTDDVYVAGYFRDQEDVKTGLLWKNGNILHSYGDDINSTSTSSVFVDGNDIYVAGYQYNGIHQPFAKLWKNGVDQNLTDVPNTYAREVLMSDAGIIYVLGLDRTENNYLITLWKIDGAIQEKEVLTNNINYAYGFSLFVYSTDVYVAGTELTDQGAYVATLWKNGEAQTLNDGLNDAFAYSVFVK